MMADQKVHERQRPFAVALPEPPLEEGLGRGVDVNANVVL